MILPDCGNSNLLTLILGVTFCTNIYGNLLGSHLYLNGLQAICA
jgi:hypothetical protein